MDSSLNLNPENEMNIDVINLLDELGAPLTNYQGTEEIENRLREPQTGAGVVNIGDAPTQANT